MAEFKDLFQSADWKKEKHAVGRVSRVGRAHQG